MIKKLKPCPFCGSISISESEEIYVDGEPENCTMCETCWANADSVERWNTRRTEDDLKARIAELEKELSQSNFYYEKYQEYEELFKESVVKHELAKASIAELEAERT